MYTCHKFLSCLIAAYVTFLIAAPAYASGMTLDQRYADCGKTAGGSQAFVACVEQIQKDCTAGKLADVATADCTSSLADEQFALMEQGARGSVSAPPSVTPTSPVSAPPAAPAEPPSAPLAVHVTPHPAAAIVYAFNPLGSRWNSCGSCVELRFAQSHPGGVYVFSLNGQHADVLYRNDGAGLEFADQKMVDTNNDGVFDEPPSGVGDPSVAVFYIVGRPGDDLSMGWTQYALDPTSPDGLYMSTGLSRGPGTVKLTGETPHTFTVDF